MGMPGLNVLVPAFPHDVKGLVKTALRTPEPVIFLMHKRLTGTRGPVGRVDELVPFGRAIVLRVREDCTIIGLCGSRPKALSAAGALSALGTSAEVIDLRTLAPLDLATCVSSVENTGRAVVVDEAPKFAGPGAEIAAALQEAAFTYLDAPAA